MRELGPKVVEYVAATVSLTLPTAAIQGSALDVNAVTADPAGHAYALALTSAHADLVRLTAGQPLIVLAAFSDVSGQVGVAADVAVVGGGRGRRQQRPGTDRGRHRRRVGTRTGDVGRPRPAGRR